VRNAKNAKVVELAIPRHAEESRSPVPRGIEELKRVLNESPQDVELRLALAREYQMAGMTAEALDEFAMCLPSRPDDVDLLCDLAVCYLRQEGRAHAAVLTQQALARDPQHAFALLIEERIGLNAASENAAAQILVAGFAVEQKPSKARERVEAMLAESRRLRAEGGTEQAAALLKRMLTVYPGDLTAARELGFLNASTGNWREAFRWFAEVRRQSPGDWETRWRAAAAAWQMDELDRAAALAREALSVNPEAVEAVELLSGVAFERSRYEEAEFWLRRLLGLDGSNRRARYRLAWIELRSGRFREAAEGLRECVGDAECGGEALYHLGLALTAMGEAEEAVATLARAWEASPSDDAALALAQAALMAGDPGRAGEALKKLAEPDDEAARLWHALSGALLESGDAEAAKRAYGEAVRLDDRRAEGYFALQSQS
jgi:Flp pilus assembly protein TadD